MEENQKDR